MFQKDLKRKHKIRPSHDRMLITCEGKKTEPSYFNEIRIAHRLSSTHIQILPSERGTSPLQVVEYAKDLFCKGNPHKGIEPCAFEQIYAVFDRDEHPSYFDALKLANSLDQQLRNDLKKKVIFRAIPSVPCFELWLLLHFQKIQHSIDRNDVLKRLKKYIPYYEKRSLGIFNLTKNNVAIAQEHALYLAQRYDPYNGEDPYTDIHQLVDLLIKKKLD